MQLVMTLSALTLGEAYEVYRRLRDGCDVAAAEGDNGSSLPGARELEAGDEAGVAAAEVGGGELQP